MPRQTTDKETTSVWVRMDSDLHEALRQRAESEERTLAGQVRKILTEHLAENQGDE
jgi:hypothetical protein